MADITSGTFILLIGSGSPDQEMDTSPVWESMVRDPSQAFSIIFRVLPDLPMSTAILFLGTLLRCSMVFMRV